MNLFSTVFAMFRLFFESERIFQILPENFSKLFVTQHLRFGIFAILSLQRIFLKNKNNPDEFSVYCKAVASLVFVFRGKNYRENVDLFPSIQIFKAYFEANRGSNRRRTVIKCQT